jgi:hypothetical protein
MIGIVTNAGKLMNNPDHPSMAAEANAALINTAPRRSEGM